MIPRVGVWQQLQFAPAQPDGNNARIVLVVQISDPASKPDRQSKHHLLTTPRVTKLLVIFSWLVRLRQSI